MYLICYDIASDSLRTKFCKFLKKFGKHVQYSIFEIDNSPRYLKLILVELDNKFKKKFSFSDSVIIYQISENDRPKILRYGWAVTEETDLVMF